MSKCSIYHMELHKQKLGSTKNPFRVLEFTKILKEALHLLAFWLRAFVFILKIE